MGRPVTRRVYNPQLTMGFADLNKARLIAQWAIDQPWHGVWLINTNASVLTTCTLTFEWRPTFLGTTGVLPAAGIRRFGTASTVAGLGNADTNSGRLQEFPPGCYRALLTPTAADAGSLLFPVGRLFRLQMSSIGGE